MDFMTYFQGNTEPVNSMGVIVPYLYRAEGASVHRNSGESDITSAGGIYRKAHPNARIFDYYDNIAKGLRIYGPSSTWEWPALKAVQEGVNESRVTELVTEFYEDYLKDAKLDLMPMHAKIAMMSMYTNSTTKAWKAVQQSIKDMGSSEAINKPAADIGGVDGIPGRKTRYALQIIRDKSATDDSFGRYFEALILSNMKTQYITLALANPTKYMKYLRGWNNRMDHLNRM